MLCLLGPTGTGKTEAALLLAEALGGEVVNFDSRQVYREVPLVTAQPTALEQARCPHHLYGFMGCAEAVSAGSFALLAAAVCREVFARGAVPILVGGTGLYLRAILEGMAPIPDVPEEVRRQVQEQWFEEGGEELHARLADLDPEYAARIHPNDRQRVTRALEVHRATGRTFSQWHADTAPALDLPHLKLGLALDKPALDARLAARIEAMLAAGALEEMRRAVQACPDRDAPGLTGIGCAELAAHLRGDISFGRARELWLKNTKAYAKRQMTWFKKDQDVVWFAPGQERAMLETAARWLDEALSGPAPGGTRGGLPPDPLRGVGS